jgi:hypothetical protein
MQQPVRASRQPGQTARAGQPAIKKLHAAVKACSSVAQLLDLHQRRGRAFNHVHACSVLHRLLEVAPQLSDDEDADPGATSLASFDGAASLPRTPGPSSRQTTGRLLVWQGEGASQSLPLTPMSTADSDSDSEETSRRSSHALATTSQPAEPLSSPRVRQAVNAMVASLASQLLRSAQRLDGRSVGVVASALARLRFPHEALLSQLEIRSVILWEQSQQEVAAARHPSQPAADAAAGLEAVPAAVPPPAGKPQRERPSTRRPSPSADALQLISPHAFVSLAAAFGASRHRPSAAWVAAATAALAPALPALAAPPHRTLPTLLASLGNASARPPVGWMSAAVAATLPHLPSYSPAQLRALAAALASARHLPDDPWVARYLSASCAQLPLYGPDDLAVTLGSLAALGCRPDDAWMAAFYRRAMALMGGGMSALEVGRGQAGPRPAC